MLTPVPDQKETGRILTALRDLGQQDPANAVLRGEAARRLLRGAIQAGALKMGATPLDALREASRPDLDDVAVVIDVRFE